MKKILLIMAGFIMLAAFAAVSLASGGQLKLLVDGQEIEADVPPQIINGRTMVPVRWVAEALGAEVSWDGKNVFIKSNGSKAESEIDEKRVADWIVSQGKQNKESYYLEGLTFETVNLDSDGDLEVVARIDGAVHLGNFFVFDKAAGGNYVLSTEQEWKVESWDFANPINIGGKQLYKLITRTGGTGLDVFNVVLWHLDSGKFIEAWQGLLYERCVSLQQEFDYLRQGNYKIDSEIKRLYAWQTTHRLEKDGITPRGDINTETTIYKFDGSIFLK